MLFKSKVESQNFRVEREQAIWSIPQISDKDGSALHSSSSRNEKQDRETVGDATASPGHGAGGGGLPPVQKHHNENGDNQGGRQKQARTEVGWPEVGTVNNTGWNRGLSPGWGMGVQAAQRKKVEDKVNALYATSF